MKLLLRSKNWQKIVNSEEKKPEPPNKSSSSNPNTLTSSLKEISTTFNEKDKNNHKFIKLLADLHKKNVKAITLFICNIDLDFLNKIYVDNTTKTIWDHLQNQFGKKGFMLQYTLFIHFMTSKFSAFNTS